MESFVCLGLAVLLVPIVVVVIGAVELRKLKRAVSHLDGRVARLESSLAHVEVAPSAPIIKPAPAPSPSVAVPPPLPPQAVIQEPDLPRSPAGKPAPLIP